MDKEYGMSNLMLAIGRLKQLKDTIVRESMTPEAIIKELDGILVCLDDVLNSLGEE